MKGKSTKERTMISTTEAAERLGITQGRVRQICRGHKTPDGRTFGKKLARDWFLSERDLRQIANIIRPKSENSPVLV